jgi:hypothetical protein
MNKCLQYHVVVRVGVCLLLGCGSVHAEDAGGGLVVYPATVTLSGDNPRQQLLVSGPGGAAGADWTASVARYTSETPSVVAVDAAGVVTPVASGTGVVRVEAEGRVSQVSVTVGDLASAPLDFERDIQPYMARFGCNAGACHGKQRGQNGFQLSLLGFDHDFDHYAMVSEARGRRVSVSTPKESLLLTKPLGTVPHGGGIRITQDGAAHRAILRWLEEGATRKSGTPPALVKVTVWPTERLLVRDERQRLVVTAHYADGSTRDVSSLAQFTSSNSVFAEVSSEGVVKAGKLTGEAAIMARYEGNFALTRVSMPLPGDVPAAYYASLPRANFIDDHIWASMERLGLKASEPCSDATYLRRVTIDIAGRVPTVEEARAFLADGAADKRERAVERLLASPDYAWHWANKWADLLRPNPYHVGIKATVTYDDFIRDAFRRNQPYDQFVRELLTAKGSTWREGQTVMFRDRRAPDELTTIVSQLFLGTRLECAKCHHHPFEVWGQADYYSFAAYFSRLGRKGTGISAPISGSEEFIFTAKSGEVSHPLTGQVLPPKPLFGTTRELAEGEDRRLALAEWITAPENHLFARTMANRVWTDLMGVGLVMPVDDLRATNPATNEPLLVALGNDFRDHRFDIQHLIRRITSSAAYALASEPNERNSMDTRNYSRHYRQRLRGEVLLDAVCEVTGVGEEFQAMPSGSSAKELWTHRIDSLFLDAFGRPNENQDPPCERTNDTTVVQALHVMNSDSIASKVTSDAGRAAALAKSDKSPAEIVDELYLAIYARLPSNTERQIGVGLYKDGSDRRLVTEDLMWALINTPEFWFKD